MKTMANKSSVSPLDDKFLNQISSDNEKINANLELAVLRTQWLTTGFLQ